jgi:hypothetical protein
MGGSFGPPAAQMSLNQPSSLKSSHFRKSEIRNCRIAPSIWYCWKQSIIPTSCSCSQEDELEFDRFNDSRHVTFPETLRDFIRMYDYASK